jgi:hypothetical protein
LEDYSIHAPVDYGDIDYAAHVDLLYDGENGGNPRLYLVLPHEEINESRRLVDFQLSIHV